MTRILFVNPNTTASMTEKVGEAARAVASAGTEILARNPATGPAAIQGHADGEAALPGLFAELEKAADERLDAFVIACFDDTGLFAARSKTDIPVLGICEAGCLVACMVADRFSVVTTLSVSVPILEDNIATYGLAHRCARVRASDVAVLELEIPGSSARQRISDEIARAIAQDDIQAIVLGCAGMADLALEMSKVHGIPVIDGVAAAVKLAECLASLHLPVLRRHPQAESTRARCP